MGLQILRSQKYGIDKKRIFRIYLEYPLPNIIEIGWFHL